MKIIFTILLTLVLVSCGEIRLEIGGDDVGEVGEWAWMPTTLEDGRTGNNAYLVNTRTGAVNLCVNSLSQTIFLSGGAPPRHQCWLVASPTLITRISDGIFRE